MAWTTPETALWLALVARLWNDAWTASDTWIRNSDRHCEPEAIRSEARRWFLVDFGDWREDRETVCGQAGLDPDVIHKAALRRKELAAVADQERDRLERESIDRAMESLAVRASSMLPGRVNRAMRDLAEREEAMA